MKNLLKDFKAELSRAVIDAIWAAWAEVGVMGQSQPSSARIVDPEPLLLLTLECARQDPRVFDEVLDWLVRNGRWVNVVRLSTLLKEDQICPPSLAGAVAAFMVQHDKSPKWRKIAERCRPEPGLLLTPLFQRQGKPLIPMTKSGMKFSSATGGRDRPSHCVDNPSRCRHGPPRASCSSAEPYSG